MSLDDIMSLDDVSRSPTRDRLRLDIPPSSIAGGGGQVLPSEIPEPLTPVEDLPASYRQKTPSQLGDNPEDHPIAEQNGTEHLLNRPITIQDPAAVVDASRNRPNRLWKKRHVKLLVVGDAGLGKTTLIRTLLTVPGRKLQVHSEAETSMEQFRRDPDSLCFRLFWRDDDCRTEWHYSVQDTPGYGDKINVQKNISIMVDFVTRQNQKWFEIETSRKRPADLSTVDDPRFDICLFCLPPHRMRYIDVRFMHELSKVVPIIPIIAKADTMNVREATIYRQEVHSKLQNIAQYGLQGKIGLFEFQKMTLERAGVDPSVQQFRTLPFLIVASNDVAYDRNQQNIFWPIRQYAWGTCEPFNPEHSDMGRLRLLLVKEGLDEISAAKLERYELWRRKRLSRVKIGLPLKLLILLSTAVMAWSAGSSISSGRPLKQILLGAGRNLLKRILRSGHRRSKRKKPISTLLIPQPTIDETHTPRAMFG